MSILNRRRASVVRRGLCLAICLALLSGGIPLDVYGAEPEAFAELIEQQGFESAEVTATTAEDPGEVSSALVASDSLADTVESLKEGEEDTEPAQPTEVAQIEINQGLSSHTGKEGGDETLINSFAAKKETAVMMKIPGSDSFTDTQAADAIKEYKLEAKDVQSGRVELNASGDSFSAKQAYDKDCNNAGWYAVAEFSTGPDKGTYDFSIRNGETEVGKREKVTFYETTSLNILVVPVKAYWSKATKSDSAEGGAPEAAFYSCKEDNFYNALGEAKPWTELCNTLKEYLLDVYPIAEVTFHEGQELDAGEGNQAYDMVTADGQKKLWEDACRLQTKTKDGKDRYDLILAFVKYRQDDNGSGQGYTFGKPTNIITYSDKDMLPTVVHEIAHCYQVGDEYDGGSFNDNVNLAPNGYSGRDFVTGNDKKTSGAADYWMDTKTYKTKYSGSKEVDENGSGTLVPLSLHPYSLSQRKFIKWAEAGNTVYPTICYMGSGFSQGTDGYYWTSSVIWDHLLKQFLKKEKKEKTQTEETGEETNVNVYLNALRSGAELDEIEEDDLYYDDDIRWGDSRMVEVSGWFVKENEKAADFTVEMEPMFSYDGDLEFIEPLDELYKDSNEVYTFAALDENGDVVESPRDGNYSIVEFYGGFYNPRTKKAGELQKEVNFNFDAEYPEGTADFAIIKGRIGDDGSYDAKNVLWKATDLGVDFANKPEGYLSYADVNSETAEVEWVVNYAPEAGETEAEEGSELYTEVYYCPEGDEGETYFICCSEDEEWKKDLESGSVYFEIGDLGWTRNAYVWIKVTNGVNALDIYSDENDMTISFSTIELSGKGLTKTQDGRYTVECTGSAIEPTTKVTVKNPETGKVVTLKKDTDYTVTYEDNVEVGFATVIVQGIGQYPGRNTAEFEIVKKALAAAPETIPDLTWSEGLNEAVQKYLILTNKDGSQLVYNNDFTVKYTVDGNTKEKLSELIPSAPEVDTPVTVTYFGKGNYTGENKDTAVFTVLAEREGITDLTGCTVLLKKVELPYTGKAVKPQIKSVTLKDGTVLKASDYKVAYSNNRDIGTGKVTIAGRKNYIGSGETTFEIVPKEVTSLSVSGLKNQPYTGSEIKIESLPVIVKAGGSVLTKDIDYTIEKIEGADYTKATVAGTKVKPGVVIKLITTEKAKKDGKKASQYPRVKWGSKVKEEKKSVTKTFSIVQTKLNSASVTVSAANKEQDKNKVLSRDGKELGTLRSSTRAEQEELKKKFDFVIEGEGEVLVKEAVISGAIALKVYGTPLGSDAYTTTVTKTVNGQIGTITIKAVKGSSVGGSRSVKFLYQAVSEDEKSEDTGTE
ncbi:MAG: hypothetical protein IJT16_10190 [Lachnospiraceae bacterium]|nr:hypothetical protein [Lachnospiraceae bacterium]